MKNVNSIAKRILLGLVLGGAAAVSAATGKITLDSEGWDKPWTTSVSVSRGQEHTFWVTGLTPNTSVNSLSVEGTYTYTEDGEKWEDWIRPTEWVDVYDNDGVLQGMYVLLTSEDWDWVPDSVRSVSFDVVVGGFYDDEVKANNSFTFNHAAGRSAYPADYAEEQRQKEEEARTPTGSKAKPLSVTFKETSFPTNFNTVGKTDTLTVLSSAEYAENDNDYYITASLTAGRKYFFGYTTASTNLKWSVTFGEKDILEIAKSYTNFWTTCAEAYEFVPADTGTYRFYFSGGAGDSFVFCHAALPKRSPAEHKPSPLKIGETVVGLRPGYLNDPESGFYDDIVDGCLYEVSGFEKGAHYIIETSGATAPIRLRLYNSTGADQGQNRYAAAEGLDCRLGWTSPSAASTKYYVGVCQDVAEGDPLVENCSAALTIRKVELEDWETTVKVVPTTEDSPFSDAAGGSICEERELSDTQWANTYVIPGGRKGVKYHAKTRLTQFGNTHGLLIGAKITQTGTTSTGGKKVYTLCEKEAGLAISAEEDISGGYGPSLEFVAEVNGPITIELSVSEANGDWGGGPGLDYGPYELCVIASGDYGVLGVDMLGEPADKMQWILKKFNGTALSGEIYYDAGAETILEGGKYEIAAKAAVTGFVTPTNRFCDVVVGEERRARFKYDDTVDYNKTSKASNHKDDRPSGTIPGTSVKYAPNSITPSVTGQTVSRSLFATGDNDGTPDTADWYAFTPTAGVYYKFALTEKGGTNTVVTPVVSVFSNETDECAYTLLRDPTKAVQILAGSTKKHYVRVAHADSEKPVDSSYTLTAYKVDPGLITLSSAEVKVKEGTAYVDVKVSRSSSDGKVRVKYATKAGTAKPGENYYPASGILTWGPKDKSVKTIRINLIPSLYAAWNPDKVFTVEFATMTEDEVDPDTEYIPLFKTDKTGAPIDVCTVTITENAKKAPGTIQVSEEFLAERGSAGATVKKPVFDVVAGESLEIPLERVLGTNGLVGVVVSTVKGTANKSAVVDFEPFANFTNRWENGEDGVRADTPIVLQTYRTYDDYATKKTFTVKLTAINTNTKTHKEDGVSVRDDPIDWDKPTLVASTITVNILNDKYTQSTPDWVKEKKLPAGVTSIKESKSGNWFCEDDGKENLYSVIARKFTGPTRVWWGPDEDHLTNVLYIAQKKTATVTMRSEDVYTNEVLEAATAAAPTFTKAVIAAAPTALCFNALPDDAARGVGYRVFCISQKETRKRGEGKSAKKWVLGDPETEVFPDENGDYVFDEFGPGTNYDWRVDTLYTNEVGEILLANTNSTKWTLSAIAADSPIAKAKRFTNGEEKEDFGQTDKVALSLRLGVAEELRFYDPYDGTTTVTKVNGTYPTGFATLKQEKPDTQDASTWYWTLKGAPTKAGHYELVMQMKRTDKKGATTVTVPYVSTAVSIDVCDVPKAVPVTPTLDKSVVKPGSYKLSFVQEEGISYRVFFTNQTNKAKLGVYDKNLRRCPTELEPPYEVEIGAGTNYSWQVYSFYEGGSVSSATNKSSVFTLTGAPVDADGNSYETVIAGTDAYDKPFDMTKALDATKGDNTMVLRQRLPASFEIRNDNGKLKSVALVSNAGTLPTGLKLEQDKGTTKQPGSMKWFVRGTPTKTGDFTVLVQATYTNYVQQLNKDGTPQKDKKGNDVYKAVETKAASTPLVLRVETVETVADLTFTLAGPGRFTYEMTSNVEPIGWPRKTEVVYVASGSKSVVLKDVKHLYWYEYVPLPKVTPLKPLVDKAVVKPDADVEFKFTKSACADVRYNVYALSSGAYWMKPQLDSKGDPKTDKNGNPLFTKTNYKLGDPATQVQPDEEGRYFTNVVYDATNKGKYTWRVDSYFEGGTVTNSTAVLNFTVAQTNAYCSTDKLADTRVDGVDVMGNGLHKAGAQDIVLRRLVKTDIAVGAEGATVSKLTGTLPTGVSLKQVEVRKEGSTSIKRYFLTGTPSKAGTYQVMLQEKRAYPTTGKSTTTVAGTTTVIDFTVLDSCTAQGTFTGLATTFDVEDGIRTLASATVTAGSTGSLSASVKIGGKTYTFKDTGYTYQTIDAAGTNLTAVLTYVQTFGSGKAAVVSTNKLYYTVCDMDETLPEAWRKEGSIVLDFPWLGFASGTNRTPNVRYEGKLCRDNSKLITSKANDAFVADVSEFAGYYTVSLTNPNPLPGDPKGNGFVTMTLDAKGKAKFTGYLADGTTYSASSVAANLIGEGDDEKLRLPLYACSSTSTKPYVFGGWLELRFRDVKEIYSDAKGEHTTTVKVPVAYCNAPDTDLVWMNDNPQSTRDGEFGFQLWLYPSGGWYDTVKNLQAWYLYRAFEVNLPDQADDLEELAETLPDGYEFAAKALPGGQKVDVIGDTVTVEKQKLVKEIDPSTGKATKLNDWALCTNAANVTVTFKRATGIISGSFDLWYQGTNAKGDFEQVTTLYKGLKHNGVYVPYRWNDGFLEDDVWTSGYFLAPQKLEYYDEKAGKTKTRSWTGSYRFDIRAVPVKHDWAETPVPDVK